MNFEESSEPEADTEVSNESYEDRDTIKNGRQALGLTRNYVPSWTSRDAFREFFQNWVDGMIEAHKVTRDTIKINTNDSDKEWVATAHRPGSGGMIGFIRFLKKKGTLELSNFKAQLHRKALDIGVSTKRTANDTAGTHGEGFKVASLVMVRKGYQVRYESSKYYWSFQFGGRDKRHLYCHLTPMKDSEISKRMLVHSARTAAGRPRDLVSNIWEDVSVKIGKVYSAKGNQIETSTFLDWIKVSFELNRPPNCIKTPDGDLILSKNFGGQMYLKGLYIGNSATTKALKFGYNMSHGDVNRDRQRLINGAEEAAILAKIWGSAITAGDEEALNEYTRMFRDDQNQWADINLAENYISNAVAAKIFARLLTSYPHRDVFFHSIKDAAKDVLIINTDLKKLPIALSMCLWNSLRRFGLVRTPEEHCHYLLQNAPISTVKESSYSEGVKRALRAALALDDRTRCLNVTFKVNPKAYLDLLVVGSDLFINDKFLDFDKSHQRVSCFLSQYKIDPPDFPCDHIIVGLHESILRELKKRSKSPQQSSLTKFSSRLKLEENLRQMPRLIDLAPGNAPGELAVSWSISESGRIYDLYGLDLMCRVTLHRQSTCSDRREDLIFDSDGVAIDLDFKPLDGNANCGCRFSVVSQRFGKLTFKKLDCNDTYFPMIARNYDHSFFGTPPPPIKPATEDAAKNVSIKVAEDGAKAKTKPDSQKTGNATLEERPKSDSSDDNDAAIDMEYLVRSTSVQSAVKLEVEEKQSSSGIAIGGSVTPDPKPPVSSEQHPHIKALKSQVNQLSMTLQSKQREIFTVTENLQCKNEDLVAATEALESKDIELRQIKAANESEIQRLSSIIEDLRGDNQLLHESEVEREAQLAELTITVKSLHAEVQELQHGKIATEAQHDMLSSEVQRLCADSVEGQKFHEKAVCHRKNSPDIHRSSNTSDAPRTENRGMKKIIESLQKEVKQMVPLLQGVLGMIQSMVNLGSRASVVENQTADIKREQLSDENSAPQTAPRPSKRQRTTATIKQEESIDLTDD
ncbi:hypothetical protein BKA65DRAFT_560112 [Rhexocercosporidium sp. MPI-PUGE-AT-0058]|nr:hypothetical protein BKA65DRAFT_560112 [Rhexocercosporidium sp. MPI-PUGE-AT-0058]